MLRASTLLLLSHVVALSAIIIMLMLCGKWSYLLQQKVCFKDKKNLAEGGGVGYVVQQGGVILYFLAIFEIGHIADDQVYFFELNSKKSANFAHEARFCSLRHWGMSSLIGVKTNYRFFSSSNFLFAFWRFFFELKGRKHLQIFEKIFIVKVTVIIF